MPTEKRPLKVFLCHASTDKPQVRELYRYLRKRGIRPWLDETDLVGGQDWQVEIPKALATSDVIIICLTKNSVDKEGYIQKEIKFALDKALEMPEGRIFLIPVRFEECEVPFSLGRYQWVDLFDEAGYARMMRALKFRASQLQRATVEMPKKDIEEEKLALEKAVREKAEKVALEKAQREAADKAKREKAEREAIERAAREKAQREAAEKAKREKAERQAVRRMEFEKAISKSFTTLKSSLSQVKPLLRIAGFTGIVIALLWGGSLAIPKFISLLPTSTATSTQRPTAEATFTNSPVHPTKTLMQNTTPTKTPTPIPTALPTEITDTNGAQMVLVPAGDFVMGVDEGIYGAEEAMPARTVYLDSFYIDKYEASVSQYKNCMSENECEIPINYEQGVLGREHYFINPAYEDFPVVNVTWNMAMKYCEWRGGRLPTEAEWEKAGRGTDGRSFPWAGADVYCPANLEDYSYSSCVGGDNTMRVDDFPNGKSVYGTYNMIGNVWEWVEDWYSAEDFTDFSTGNPRGPSNGEMRVIRGGSFNNAYDYAGTYPYQPFFVYIYTRAGYEPDSGDGDIGFRCARNVNP